MTPVGNKVAPETSETGSRDMTPTEPRPCTPPESLRSVERVGSQFTVTRTPSAMSIDSGGGDKSPSDQGLVPIKHKMIDECWASLKYTCQAICENKWFDRIIMLAILLNSLMMALADYSSVEKGSGELKQEGSVWNTIIAESEWYFLGLFSFEMTVKMVALNMKGKNSYFSDSWNWLDFGVVISGLIALVPGVPSVSVIRTVRALRPLRSINSFPGLKALVICILTSIPQLASVMVLLGFVFMLFGIGGVQMFGGPFMHARCRETPYPVLTTYTRANAVYDLELEFPYVTPSNATFSSAQWKWVFDKYKCVGLDDSDADPSTTYQRRREFNFDVEEDNKALTKGTSKWATPRDCYWPLDDEMERLCALTNMSGYHTCYNGDDTGLDIEDWRWCGSDYDAKGNLRFQKSGVNRRATYIEGLNWGMTNFDNLLYAAVTIFQSITEEGWSDIMYQAQDSHGAASTVFFVFLIIFGAFFVLQLLLAVLEDNFSDATLEVANEDNSGGGFMPYLKRAVNIICPFEWKDWWWRVKIRNLVQHAAFDQVVTFFIVINTVTLSMDHHDMDPLFNETLESINFVLTCFFAIEMVLKLLGLGFLKYVEDPFNVFDGLIVITSIITSILAPPALLTDGAQEQSSSSFSVLRTFRLFRVLKLITKSRKMRALVSKIISTCKEMSSFSVLLFLFIYIFALIGMQFFANRFRFRGDEVGDSNVSSLGKAIHEIGEPAWEEAGDRPRSNFDTFGNAFASVFQVITTENWNMIMYDCWRVSGPSGVMYTVCIVLLGNFILKNLFLAILLHHFSKQSRASDDDDGTIEGGNSVDDNEGDGSMIEVRRALTKSQRKAVPSESKSKPGKKDDLLNPYGQTPDDFDFTMYDDLSFSKEVGGVFPLNPQASLNLFGPLSPTRDFCARTMAHKSFDQVVLVLIVISTVTLIMDSPLDDPDGELVKVLTILDYVMTGLFTCEMTIKIIAIGFVAQEGAYLRNGWNVLDFIIVCISLLGVAMTAMTGSAGSSFKGLKAMRALRGLRPLRMINRAPGLKIVVNALLAAIPDVVNVAGICALFLLIFGIFGVSTFKGQLNACGGDDFEEYEDGEEGWGSDDTLYGYMEKPVDCGLESTVGPPKTLWNVDSDECMNVYADNNDDCITATSKEVCECWGGKWQPVVQQKFDNVFLAMISFFEMSTTEGWVDIMYAAVDSTGIDMQPIRDYSPGWIYFFIFYTVTSNFLAVNLFVGVVIDNFNSMKKQVEDGSLMFLTPEQREWLKTQEMTRHLKPKRVIVRPNDPFLAICYDIDHSHVFETSIQICIILNTVVMAIQYLGQDDIMTGILFGLNCGFAIVFTLEMIIKLCSQKWDYFKSAWNRFDCVLTVVNDVGILVAALTRSNSGMVIGVIRTFRVVRIIRAMNRLEQVNHLIDTLIFTLPGLANIAALLALLFIIYGVMGVQFFAKTAFYQSYNAHANFQDFGTAVVTLLRMCTGEAWGNFMYDLAYSGKNEESDEKCDDDPKYDENMCGFHNGPGCEPLTGCGTAISYPYFISFTLLVGFVYLNLFIGYILEGFSAASKREAGIRPQDFPKFADHWADFDPDATCYIPTAKLYEFVFTLYKPLGFESDNSFTPGDVMARITTLKLTKHEGQVHFKDVLKALSAAALKRINAQTNLEAAVEIKLKGQGHLTDLDDPNAANAISDAMLYEKVSRGLKVTLDASDFQHTASTYMHKSSRGSLLSTTERAPTAGTTATDGSAAPFFDSFAADGKDSAFAPSGSFPSDRLPSSTEPAPSPQQRQQRQLSSGYADTPRVASPPRTSETSADDLPSRLSLASSKASHGMDNAQEERGSTDSAGESGAMELVPVPTPASAAPVPAPESRSVTTVAAMPSAAEAYDEKEDIKQEERPRPNYPGDVYTGFDDDDEDDYGAGW